MDTKTQIRAWVDEFCSAGGHSDLPKSIKIFFSDRFTKRFGEARWIRIDEGITDIQIHLSSKIWKLAKEEDHYFVVGHEVAHIITAIEFGPKVAAHGKEWASVMKRLGLPPQKYHTIDTSSLKRRHKRYLCLCSCKGKEWRFTARKLKSSWRCGVCNTIIVKKDT